MSRIYFHSPSEETEVRGYDRAMLGSMVSDVSWPCLNVSTFRLSEDPIFKLLPPGCYLTGVNYRDEHARYESFKTWFNVGMDGGFVIDGADVSIFSAQLNTIATMGSDTMCFLARIHAQCESHGWIDGPNRAWAAGLLEDALDNHVFIREDAGWRDVIAMLRKRDDEPVVTSYSVCESFPDPWHLFNDYGKITKHHEDCCKYGGEPDPDFDCCNDCWADQFAEDTSVEQMWEWGMDWLRKQTGMLEWTPETNRLRYGHMLDCFEIRAKAEALRQPAESV